MKKLTIDRFEGQYAICEDENKTMLKLKKSKLPENVKENDIILILEDGSIIIDKEETQKARKNICDLQDELWK